MIEPADRSVVLDVDGWAWQRSGNIWNTTTTLLAPHDWIGLRLQRGPLTPLVPVSHSEHHVGSWALLNGCCMCECDRCWREYGDGCICSECTEESHEH